MHSGVCSIVIMLVKTYKNIHIYIGPVLGKKSKLKKGISQCLTVYQRNFSWRRKYPIIMYYKISFNLGATYIITQFGWFN